LSCTLVGAGENKDNATCKRCSLRVDYVRLIDHELPGKGKGESPTIYSEQRTLSELGFAGTAESPWWVRIFQKNKRRKK
jgi:hypothetical protein